MCCSQAVTHPTIDHERCNLTLVTIEKQCCFYAIKIINFSGSYKKLYMDNIVYLKKNCLAKLFFELIVKFEKFHFLKIDLKLSDTMIKL